MLIHVRVTVTIYEAFFFTRIRHQNLIYELYAPGSISWYCIWRWLRRLYLFSVNFSCDTLRRFQCDNHLCIPRYQLCDGLDNCWDGSDENNMTLCASRIKPCNLYAEYQCANKKCIDRGRVCDFADDCGDFSDELGCRKLILYLISNVSYVL